MTIEEENMNCFMCKGTVKEAYSSFTTDMGDCVIVVKKVPSCVCGQCGEVSYSDEVARQLEQIVRNITSSAKTEVAIVSYSKMAA